MESTKNPPIDDEGGLLDVADMDPELVAPDGWHLEQDELPFDAYDEDEDSDG
jgi:hypothetical protein